MKKMNWLKTIENVHKVTNNKKIKILLDIIICRIKYKATSRDYDYFEMYKMSEFERSTYLTKGKNKDLIKKYNHPKFMKLVNNPIEFHKIFTKFINREWLEINNLKSFKKFCTNQKEGIAFSNKRKKQINIEKRTIEKVYKELTEKKYLLIEEIVKTTGSLKKISSTSNISIRIITILGKCLSALLYIEEENIQLMAPVDLDTGKILFRAEDQAKNKFTAHPKTKKEILGIEIPNWERIKEVCEEACLEIPEVGYIEWTFVIGEKKIDLVKVNTNPEYDLFQRVTHQEHNIGMIPLIKKKEERKIEN